MERRNVIQPASIFLWASLVVLVQKKDGSLRFCINYRKLNGIKHKDAYPIPSINDTLDTLAGSTWFTTLDLVIGKWRYWTRIGRRQHFAHRKGYLSLR